MRQGAFDFLTKPYVLDVMLATVKRACERTALLRETPFSEPQFESWKAPMRLLERVRAFVLCAN